MESIWWVFKQLFSKGLVYQGVKVMPYSTACNTPLSNFESGQNYKEVVDPAVVVTFPLKDGTSLIAWTTTPWTLPSNFALCVNPKLTYVKITETKTGNVYILQENRLEATFKGPDNYVIQDKFPGIKLKGLKYEPLFDYFSNYAEKGAFQVLADGYVTDDSGTGVVHQAPYFGEDDYRVCLAAGLITRDQDAICPVDASGKFTLPVKDFVGQYVKDADKNIIALLKSKGRLLQSGQVKHSYPFCWRSETPLIYKAVPSWFVRVEHMTQNLLESSGSTYWVPEFVKEKRFGNWLRDARDWAISRNRYWGTPIPLWISPDGEEIVCVGSIEELCKLTGEKITDIHRESIDHLTIPSSRPGKPPLRRINEVFDCWFESGSMPYAQQHYPFENVKEFDEYFPADFIAEGIDQTRGWFYTLLVISTALFKKPPFKNLIANGLVLASDGQKMSKSKKNYPDPMEIVKKYGADALRLYLINSPVVRAENLRFKEEGVRDIIKDVFLPWYNAFRFLMQNVERIVQEDKIDYIYDPKLASSTLKSDNIMDKWILSFTQSLSIFVKKEMAAYRLYTVIPRLTKFISNLTNWYVRMNRKRLKGETDGKDCRIALDTLCSVLLNMISLMSPFTPFLTELMYQTLSKITVDAGVESIHYTMMPNPNADLINLDIERAVQRMQNTIELGRVLRDRKTIPIKYPLPELVIIHQDQNYLSDIVSLEKYILEEMNVRKITVSTDKVKYGVSLKAEPDHKTLGARLKGDFKAVTQAIKSLNDEQCQNVISQGYLETLGHKIDISEIRLIFQSTGANEKYEAHSDNDVLILLDVSPDEEMMNEGIAREIINRIQKLRKKAHLVPTDEIKVYYSLSDANNEISRVANSHNSFIENAIKATFSPLKDKASLQNIIIEEMQEFKNIKFNLIIISKSAMPSNIIATPASSWSNVTLLNLVPRYGAKSTQGMVLLNDFKGNNVTVETLFQQITILFGLYGMNFKLWIDDKPLTNELLKSATGKTIFVSHSSPNVKNVNSDPNCKFINKNVNGKEVTYILENPVGYPIKI